METRTHTMSKETTYDVPMHPKILMWIEGAKDLEETRFRGQLSGLAWDPREGVRPNDHLLVKEMVANASYSALSGELRKWKGEIPPELYPLVKLILDGYKNEHRDAQEAYWETIDGVF